MGRLDGVVELGDAATGGCDRLLMPCTSGAGGPLDEVGERLTRLGS